MYLQGGAFMKKHLRLLVTLAAAVVCSVCLFAFTASAEYLGNDVISLGPTPIDFGVVEHGKEQTTVHTVTVYNLLDFDITVSVSSQPGYVADSYLITVPAQGQTDVNFTLLLNATDVDRTVVFTENVHYQTCEFRLTGTTVHVQPDQNTNYVDLGNGTHCYYCPCGAALGVEEHIRSEECEYSSVDTHLYWCKECNALAAEEPHNPQEIVNDDTLCLPATCSRPASYYYTCTDCGTMLNQYFNYGQSLEHEYDTSVWQYDSESHYYVCTLCSEQDRYPHTMDYAENPHALYSIANCTSASTYFSSCSQCGFVDYASQPQPVGNATGHSFSDYEVLEEARCYSDATEIAYCDYGCGTTDVRVIPGTMSGHHYILDPEESAYASCTEDTYSVWKCEWCNDSYTEIEEGTATGHSFSDYVVFDEASCMENAKEIAYCDYGCGTTDVREIPGTIVDHHYILYPDGTVEATCTTDGQSMWMCNWCRDSYMKVEQGSATGHSFEEYVYNKDATCTADGTLTAVCSVCKETVTTVAGGSAKGHDYDAAGYCTRCGHHSGIHTPDTGDTHSTALWLVVCTLSALAFAAAALCKKRFEN